MTVPTDRIKFQTRHHCHHARRKWGVATHDQIDQILRRHLSGDWGAVDREDAAANEWALKHDERLMSVYDVNGEKLWVVTEADRSATTVLTPGEY